MSGSPDSGFRNAQIVVLSTIEWTDAWQRHQIFASQFAADGRELFFVENTGFRNPRLRDLPRLWRKLSRLIGPGRSASLKDCPVRVVAPAILPPTQPPQRWLNRNIFAPRLVSRLREAGLRPGPIVIYYSPTATTLDMIRLLQPSLTVYDCASHFQGHPKAPKDLDAIEALLLERTDLVVTDSEFLYRRMKGRHSRVERIHQGVSEAFFGAKSPSGRWETFCYYGTWGQDLDPAFLSAVASAGGRVTVSGFLKNGSAPLPPEARWLPPVASGEIVTRVQDFDAFLMPYKITPFHLGVIPAKLYECLAMGRPILATPLPSLEPFRDLVYISDRPEDWARFARDLPKTETDEKRERRIALAQEHTQGREFARLRSSLGAAWDRRGARPAPAGDAPEGLAATFLRGFSWIAAFFVLARLLSLVTQFLAAKFLGPAEFGKTNLVIALSSVIQILPMLGFPLAMSRFAASAADDRSRVRTVSSTFLLFLCWAGASLALLSPWSSALAAAAGMDGHEWRLCMALAFLTALHLVVGGSLQGLTRFRQRGLVEALYGTAALAVFVSFLLRGRLTWDSLVVSYIAALGAASAYGLFHLRSHLRLCMDYRLLREVLPFVFLGTLNVAALALIQAPGRISSFYHHSAQMAGIYSAYFTATAQIALAVGNMIYAVLIPVTSRPEGQRDAWALLRRYLPLGALLLTGVFILGATAALMLIGRSYPMRADWILLFGTSAALILIHSVFANLFAARDLRGLFVSVTGTLAAGAGNMVLNILLTPAWGVTGAAVALLAGFGIGLGWFLLNFPRPARSAG